MKTIARHITINDGKEQSVHNGDFLTVDIHPRIDAIVSAFLNDGFTLLKLTKNINPAIQKEGAFSFYKGGWDLLLTKVVDDDVEDTSDELLKTAIENSLRE